MIGFILQGLRISVPYAFAALGGTLSERAGVVNLALEAMLLCGAFATTAAAGAGGPIAGALAGAGGGFLVAAVYAWAVLAARADQIVAGVALNLLALGVTRVLLKLVYKSVSNSAPIAGLDAAGTASFVILAALLALAAHAWIARTPGGLRLRAAGEHPEAADSLGVSIVKVRLGAVLASGVLAGLGGAWMALDNHGFVDRMTGGRGYIAIAAVILGRWTPLGAAAACLLFGFADAAQLSLQTRTALLPREVIQVLPYLVALVALAGGMGRARSPKALGTPWQGR